MRHGVALKLAGDQCRSGVAALACAFVCAALFAANGADAGSFGLSAFTDTRAILPGNEAGWLDGGLGKLRYGGGDADPLIERAQIVLEPSLQATPDIFIFASLRNDTYQRKDFDLMEIYARFRPVSTGAWRWSVKLGAFYPPISLENTDTGWTSPWTLTPSAINTWIGEELRTIGGEAALEWRRHGGGTLTLHAALYEWNDAHASLISYRGWSLHDRPTGLLDRVRLPDAQAALWGSPAPKLAPEFKEIDNRPGYYAGASWRGDGDLKVEILRYDNLADAAVIHNGVRAWATEFWSGGLAAPVEAFMLMAQAMTGTTAIEPAPGARNEWNFHSAYVLLARQYGKWRFAARADLFNTGRPVAAGDTLGAYSREHGSAFALAANWEPERHLRLTLEAMRVNSWRLQRAFVGVNPSQSDLQIQLNARLYL